jgi:hypothetical protein
VRSRDVRFVNLWKRLVRKGVVALRIVRDNRRRLVTENKYLETVEIDFNK